MHKYFIATLFTSVCTVIALKLFTHFLSVEEFGVFALLQSFFIVISSFFSKFISQGIFKFYHTGNTPEFKSKLFTVLSRYVALSVVLTLLVYCILYILLPVEGLSHYIIITIAITLVTLMVDTQNAFYQATFQGNAFLLSEILRSTLKSILPISFYILFQRSFDYFLYGHLTALLITIVPQHIRFAKYGIRNLKNRLVSAETKQLGEKILTYSLPISIWYLLTQTINYIDRILLVDIYGLNTIGLYSANFSVFSFASQIVAIPLINSIHPKLLKYNVFNNNERDEFEKNLNKYTEWYIVSQFIMVGILSTFHQEITLIILKRAYLLNYFEIFSLVFGYSFWSLGSLGNKQFEIIGATRMMLLSLCISFVFYFPILYTLKYFVGEHSIFLAKAVMYISYPIIQVLVRKKYLKDSIGIKWDVNIRIMVLITLPWLCLGSAAFILQTATNIPEVTISIIKIGVSALILGLEIKYLIGVDFLTDLLASIRDRKSAKEV